MVGPLHPSSGHLRTEYRDALPTPTIALCHGAGREAHTEKVYRQRGSHVFARIALTVRGRGLMLLLLGLPVSFLGCATASLPISTNKWVDERVKPLEDRLAKL